MLCSRGPKQAVNHRKLYISTVVRVYTKRARIDVSFDLYIGRSNLEIVVFICFIFYNNHLYDVKFPRIFFYLFRQQIYLKKTILLLQQNDFVNPILTYTFCCDKQIYLLCEQEGLLLVPTKEGNS